jgi:tetratricopeptide (TPR) repeat protein
LPKILFGLFMHKMKQYKVAADAYREALKILPNDIMTKYNLGLALVELKQYQEAEAIAEEVYAAKYPLPGLKNKLAAPRAKLTSDKPESPNPAKEKPDATTTAAANPAASDDNTAANTVETPTDAGEASGQQTSTDTTKPGSTDAAAAPDEAKATASNDKPPEFTAEQLEQLKKAMREQAMLETEAASEPVSEPMLVP